MMVRVVSVFSVYSFTNDFFSLSAFFFVLLLEEANFLFELNDAVSGKDNDPAWNALFVKAISSYLLDDENSPGEIDDAEAEWLYAKVKGDGQIDGLEKELLLNLKSQAKCFPAKLEELL